MTDCMTGGINHIEAAISEEIDRAILAEHQAFALLLEVDLHELTALPGFLVKKAVFHSRPSWHEIFFETRPDNEVC